MAEIIRPELVGADGAEVTDRLVTGGVIGGVATWVGADGMHVLVVDGQESAATALLDGWTPTATRGTYVSPLPDRWRLHLQHLRDYRNGTRNGTLTATAAQTQHVVADLIDLLAYVLPRLDTDA